MLAKAVKGGALLDPRKAVINLYNLACAHGRLKELDPAFERLNAALEANAKAPVGGIDFRNDKDFENLHGDPRWEGLTKKYPPAGGD